MNHYARRYLGLRDPDGSTTRRRDWRDGFNSRKRDSISPLARVIYAARVSQNALNFARGGGGFVPPSSQDST